MASVLCTVESEIISLAKNYWGLVYCALTLQPHEIGTIIILRKEVQRGLGTCPGAQFLSDPSEF